MHIHNKGKVKKWICIVVSIILILVFCWSALYISFFSAIGAVAEIRSASIVVDLIKPTLFWFVPGNLDRVVLFVDDASKYKLGDVIYAFSGKVMYQTDPPKFSTKWCWRIHRAN